MMTLLEAGDIPSKRQTLLEKLKGQKIQRLIRFSEYSAEHLLQEYELTAEECFSLTIGPLVLAFESGLQVGIYEDIDLNSVKIRVEQNESGEKSVDAFEKDSEFFPLEANTSWAAPFWHRISGQQIRNILLIRRKPINPRFEDLPNEVGLRFELESGAAFVAGCGLSKGSFDFHVLTRDEVAREVIPELLGW